LTLTDVDANSKLTEMNAKELNGDMTELEQAEEFIREQRITDSRDILENLPQLLAAFAAEMVAKQSEWVPVDRGHNSIRWLLVKATRGAVDLGIRLGRPENGGWRIVDEYGNSTWQPHDDAFYIAEMPLIAPTDAAPFTPTTETAEEQQV
jgi:hypothetical protein